MNRFLNPDPCRIHVESFWLIHAGVTLHSDKFVIGGSGEGVAQFRYNLSELIHVLMKLYVSRCNIGTSFRIIFSTVFATRELLLNLYCWICYLYLFLLRKLITPVRNLNDIKHIVCVMLFLSSQVMVNKRLLAMCLFFCNVLTPATSVNICIVLFCARNIFSIL